MRRTLYLLSTRDLTFVLFTGRRSDVVVERKYVACPGCLLHDLGTVAVVSLYDLLVVEKIKLGLRKRSCNHLKPICCHRATLSRVQETGVVDHHLPLLEDYPNVAIVATVPVATG